MKTDEIQAASSAAAGSLATDARRPMGATGGTGRWSASVLRWRRAAAVGSSTLDPSHSKWLRWDFGTVRVVLAAVLLVAAALKSEQLWETSPQPFSSPTFALIVFEFAFAAWLLTGWLPRLTWWLAVGCFTAFALAASIKTLSGQNDCGCFGAVQLPSLVALIVDLGVLGVLLGCRSETVDLTTSSCGSSVGGDRRTPQLKLPCLMLCLGLVLAFGNKGHRDFRPRQLDLIRVLPAETVDLGWVKAGEAHEIRFDVAATTTDGVILADLLLDCQCALARLPLQQHVLPGTPQSVQFVWTPPATPPGKQTTHAVLQYLSDQKLYSTVLTVTCQLEAHSTSAQLLNTSATSLSPAGERSLVEPQSAHHK